MERCVWPTTQTDTKEMLLLGFLSKPSRCLKHSYPFPHAQEKDHKPKVPSQGSCMGMARGHLSVSGVSGSQALYNMLKALDKPRTSMCKNLFSYVNLRIQITMPSPDPWRHVGCLGPPKCASHEPARLWQGSAESA